MYFWVFNSRTRIVEENLHVKFSEETPNIAGNKPTWLFDIDALTISMNYKPVVSGNQTNGIASTKENIDTGQAGKKIVHDQEYILLPLLTSDPSLSKSSKDSPDAGFKPLGDEEKIDSEHPKNKDKNNSVDENIVYGCIDDPNMPNLEEIVYFDDDEEVDHPIEQIIGDIHSNPTRRMTKMYLNMKVWTLVDLPYGKRAIGTKWVYRNKKDDGGIMVRNKERLVAQGYTQEEDMKSITRGCQFLRRRLISWQCKKQTIVANSTTEAEYVAAANSCGQVLWIQNQLLDYGYNFMNTKIYIDNESTICIVRNPVFHSKTKHIEIRHHFIRDSYEKRLIYVIKIHTDQNVTDLLTKAFDVIKFQYLIASIGMLNL
ncbi:putative ribonuclease H-like domain-containing protein [Tanacetum coccineum]